LFAFETATKHGQYFSPDSIRFLEDRIGGEFEDLIHQKRYVSAADALEYFQLNPMELYQAWETAPDERPVQIGCHVKEVKPSCAKSFFVANAYFPYRFSVMDARDGHASAWLLSYPPDVSMRRGRRELLGDIDGDPRTLRGYLSTLASSNKLHVDKFDNGFHLSDSLGASLREAFIWFSAEDLHRIADSLSALGVNLQESSAGRALASVEYALRCSEIDDLDELRAMLSVVIKSMQT